MRFTWNAEKAASNVAKHGVAFEAASVAEMEIAVVRATLNHDGGEPRLLALVPIGNRVHALVYTIERETMHVISLRKANNREVDEYEAEI